MKLQHSIYVYAGGLCGLNLSLFDIKKNRPRHLTRLEMSDVVEIVNNYLKENNPKMNHINCVLCGEHIIGECHNPVPLADSGKCCSKCNVKVLTARVKQFGRLMIDAEMAAKKGGVK